MSESQSLVSTRAKRANAGSRLKQLIEIEEQATGVSSLTYSEDDENVRLLFQEDENDDEFEESNSEESEIEEEEETDEKEDNADASVVDDTRGTQLNSGDKGTQASDVEGPINSDEMLSDSDISLSENDESEAERELEREEKSNRKRKQKTTIPAIKKIKVVPTNRTTKKIARNYSESLLLSDRRASSRKSAMKNKAVLVQKLQEDEKKRAALTPVIRVKERQLTQEERLLQAVETEKENILSLNNFLEQEVVKKERQKLMFQQKRPKLRNVIRLLSCETFVQPVDEIEDARHLIEQSEKKRRGRKKKNATDLAEEPRPGEIDKELPYYKKLMENKRIKEEKEAEEKRKIEAEREEKRRKFLEEEESRKRKLEEERASRKMAKEERFKEFENVDVTQNHKKSSEVGISVAENVGKNCALQNETDAKEELNENPNARIKDESPVEPHETLVTEVASSIDINEADEATENSNTPLPGNSSDEINNKNAEIVGSTTPTREVQEVEQDSKSIDPETKETSKEIATEQSNVESLRTDDSEKKVKFVDNDEFQSPNEDNQNKTDTEESKDSIVTNSNYRLSKDGELFEGPVQRVSKNYVILLNFDEQEFSYLTDARVKAALFGKDANLGASRRFKEVETILKSSLRSDNPYSIQKEEKEDELFTSVAKITQDDNLFDILKRLPRLGVKEVIEEHEEDKFTEEATEIQIKTEAPSGLYLPNGNKKLCLISGKEVRYSDPSTGIPYENKEVYKVIKTIEQGSIPWLSLNRDQNSYGEVEVYLNFRDEPRHAKGVPEGFDGQ